MVLQQIEPFRVGSSQQIVQEIFHVRLGALGRRQRSVRQRKQRRVDTCGLTRISRGIVFLGLARVKRRGHVKTRSRDTVPQMASADSQSWCIVQPNQPPETFTGDAGQRDRPQDMQGATPVFSPIRTTRSGAQFSPNALDLLTLNGVTFGVIHTNISLDRLLQEALVVTDRRAADLDAGGEVGKNRLGEVRNLARDLALFERPTHAARTGTEVLMETVLCHRLCVLPHPSAPPHQRLQDSAATALEYLGSSAAAGVAGYDVLRASHMQMQAIDSDWGAAPARRRLGETKSGTNRESPTGITRRLNCELSSPHYFLGARQPKHTGFLKPIVVANPIEASPVTARSPARTSPHHPLASQSSASFARSAPSAAALTPLTARHGEKRGGL
ncbi:hypothetical protein B0H14DRAFT_2607382 [Mycena olivaceomarginata]|nr:hypothetical protein B0H14DRAFT_2607382 [Mycena olivaceomarginata]